ncbi:MAG: protein kinase domain-containing protein, partial [Kangiellaceae bacterium]
QHGVAKVLDFGIALTKEKTLSKKQSKSKPQTSIVGSQGFIAPEQINDYAHATVASDIFSFGVLMQRVFCTEPVNTNNKNDALENHEILFKKLPKTLQKIIIRCTEPNPNERYQSLTDVRNHLLDVSQGSHIAKSKQEQADEDTKDLSNQFKLLDILASFQHQRVYLFQKKSNSQLLVIKRRRKQDANVKVTRLVSSLKHPNIARIYATASNDEHNIIVSEYLSGGSLTSRLLSPMPLPQVISLSFQICSALTFAHNNKFLHTRLTPNNVVFSNDETIKLTDFSLNNQYQFVREEQLDYLPPGQQAISERYDLYSLGAILFHMLYGAPVNFKKMERKEKIPFQLETLIDRLIAIDPVNRPENSQEVLNILNKLNRKNKKRKVSNGLNSEIEELNKKEGEFAKKPSQKELSLNEIRQSSWLLIALGVSVCIIILLTIMLML